jgi:Phage integrase, N-terminal SAM-like domain
MADHELMGVKLHVYMRENSRYWQCSTYLGGRNHRKSTNEESLDRAKDVAEDWYLKLKVKDLNGEIKSGKTFRHAAAQFVREYEIITEGQRNPQYVKEHRRRLENHLLPFFGNKALAEITPGMVQEYRIHRREKALTADARFVPTSVTLPEKLEEPTQVNGQTEKRFFGFEAALIAIQSSIPLLTDDRATQVLVEVERSDCTNAGFGVDRLIVRLAETKRLSWELAADGLLTVSSLFHCPRRRND